MKRPLCAVALLYIAGILVGQWGEPLLPALFAFSFALGLAALLWPAARGWLLTILLVLAGWTNAAWRNAVISPHDLRVVAGGELQAATVRGRLRDSPVPRIFESRGREIWHSSVEIRVDSIRLQGAWQPAFGKVIAFAPGVLSSNFFNGQAVEVAGLLGPLAGPRAEGLFDARAFYRRHGIDYQLRTESDSAWSVIPESPPLRMPLADRFMGWARNTLALGLGPEDEPLRLMWTLALDWKAPLTEPVEEPFLRAGTFHIFAVDGLRIGLLAGIGIGLLRVLRRPRAICGLLVIPLIWSYAGLTGWPASAVRAAIMMTIVIGGWAAHRPVDLINSLLAAAFVILLWDPSQLFQAGFQLSFLVVLSIALVLPLIRNLFRSWVFQKDPFLPDALKPRWPPALRAAVIFIIDTCAISLAAWLGSMPLAAAYFHLFTPVSVPANILVVPITALALMSGLGSLLTGAWFPGLAILFNHAGWFFMKCIIVLSHWSAQWPSASCNVSAPSPVTFVLYYLVLFTVLTGWIFRGKIKWLTAMAIAALAVGWLGQRVVDRNTSQLYFLPLDGGSAIFAQDDGALFDCGSAKMAESVVKPFLRAHGVNSLNVLALTVGHAPQTAGAPLLLTNFSVGRVLIGPAPGLSSAYREVVQDIKQTARWRTVQSGDEAGGWTVLHPPPGRAFPEADDNALVFRREINGHSILLLSTLGRSGQDLLMTSRPDLRAEIVVAALPGRDEPLSEPLLRLLQPKLIIIIDSEFPATRRASPRLRQRLATHGAPVVYCRDTGSLKLSLRQNGWTLENAAGEIVRP